MFKLAMGGDECGGGSAKSTWSDMLPLGGGVKDGEEMRGTDRLEGEISSAPYSVLVGVRMKMSMKWKSSCSPRGFQILWNS